MVDLTKAVLDPNAPQKFRPYEEMEGLRESQLEPGKGAGFLFYAYTDKDIRGGALSTKLLTTVLTDMTDELKLSHAFAYGRLPKIGDFEAGGRALDAVGVNAYIKDVMNGDRRDWGLEFHKRSGAKIICGLPNSVDDPESRNCGFLAIYDLRKLRKQKMI